MLLPFGLPSLVSRPVRISSLVPRPVLTAVFLKKLTAVFTVEKASHSADTVIFTWKGRPVVRQQV
jgi:hypothetical protein